MRKAFVPRTLLVAVIAAVAPSLCHATDVLLETNLDVASYQVKPRETLTNTFSAPDIMSWSANNYVGISSLGPVGNAPGNILPNERHEVRSAFDQTPIADATLRTFIRSSGWYYNAVNNSVRSHVAIYNDIEVVNNTPNDIRVNFLHTTHGFIASGGTANSYTATADEAGYVSAVPIAVGGVQFQGAASVKYGGEGGTPVTNVTGDWAGFTNPTTYRLPDSSVDLYALELTRSYVITLLSKVPANSSRTFYVGFDGLYSVESTGSSMFSAGVVDFSNTGHFDYQAIDDATGLPVTSGVTFHLAGPVPEPAALLLIPLAALRRHRRS